MDRFRAATVVGGAITAATTALVFALPVLVPLDAVKAVVFEYTNQWWAGNPLTQLRLFGAVPGGLVAGYLARDPTGRPTWDVGMKAGVYASVYGLAAVYLLYVGYTLLHAVFVAGAFPPPLYVIVVFPLVFAFPLLFVHVLEGLVAGLIGTGLNKATDR